MRTRHVLAITMALGLALSAGHALAEGIEMYGAREVATVRFIDRSLNLIQLTDGTEIHAADSRMLDNVTEGEQVLVDFTHAGDTNTLNSIEAASGETTPGASPMVLDGAAGD